MPEQAATVCNPLLHLFQAIAREELVSRQFHLIQCSCCSSPGQTPVTSFAEFSFSDSSFSCAISPYNFLYVSGRAPAYRWWEEESPAAICTNCWGVIFLSLSQTALTPSTNTGWMENGLKVALRRRIWGCLLIQDSTGASKVCLQPRRPTVRWVPSRKAWPAGWGRWFCPSTLFSRDPTWSIVFSSGAPNTKKSSIAMSVFFHKIFHPSISVYLWWTCFNILAES